MKMTMHIDENMLDRVRKWTGAASKTEAVRLALKEIDRKARLAEYGQKGLGLTREELATAWDPASDFMTLRVAETSGEPVSAAAPITKAAYPRVKRTPKGT